MIIMYTIDINFMVATDIVISTYVDTCRYAFKLYYRKQLKLD